MARKRINTTRRRISRSPRYKIAKTIIIDYKDVSLLQKFITDRGKIVSKRLSGVTSKQQRQLSTSVKRARYLGLLPVVGGPK